MGEGLIRKKLALSFAGGGSLARCIFVLAADPNRCISEAYMLQRHILTAFAWEWSKPYSIVGARGSLPEGCQDSMVELMWIATVTEPRALIGFLKNIKLAAPHMPQVWENQTWRPPTRLLTCPRALVAQPLDAPSLWARSSTYKLPSLWGRRDTVNIG